MQNILVTNECKKELKRVKNELSKDNNNYSNYSVTILELIKEHDELLEQKHHGNKKSKDDGLKGQNRNTNKNSKHTESLEKNQDEEW